MIKVYAHVVRGTKQSNLYTDEWWQHMTYKKSGPHESVHMSPTQEAGAWLPGTCQRKSKVNLSKTRFIFITFLSNNIVIDIIY